LSGKRGRLWKAVLIVLLLAGTVMALSASRISRQPAAEPVYFVEGNPGQLALTFETRWSNEGLAELLNILTDEGVKATFFMTGHWLERNREAAAAILEAGHEVGNHTLSYGALLHLDRDSLEEQICGFNQLCQELLDYQPLVFRPPGGEYNGTILELAAREGMFTVLWSVESYDWLKEESSAIVERVTGRLHGGAIIQFRVGAGGLLEALPQILAFMRRHELEPVTVTELLKQAGL
jgi:peptidoglycan/xylan/chitin deacetylase (PgdA/CDA1 family)